MINTFALFFLSFSFEVIRALFLSYIRNGRKSLVIFFLKMRNNRQHEMADVHHDHIWLLYQSVE